MKERTIDEIEVKLLKWFKIGVVECGSIKLCGFEAKWACGDELHGECKVKVEEEREGGREEVWGAVSMLIFI